MPALRRAPALAVAAVLALLATGCDSGGANGGDAEPSGPSGSLGVVTQPAADRAVGAVCDMLTMPADRASLTDVFENQAHEELHVIAAATEQRDVNVAGQMLQAKERVEADLAERRLPDAWDDDTLTLLRRAQDALVAIGLTARGCPADRGYSPGPA